MPEPPGRRLLGVAALLLAAASAALGAAAALGWSRQVFDVPLRGAVPVAVDGGAVAPALGPLALVALAAIAALLAIGGQPRRVVGLLLLAAAALPAWWALGALVGWNDLAAVAERSADLAPRSAPRGSPAVQPVGPGAALLAALLLAAAGLLVVARGHRMPRLGARFRTPAARRGEPAGDALDPERAQDLERELWDSLDAGEDPTERPR